MTLIIFILHFTIVDFPTHILMDFVADTILVIFTPVQFGPVSFDAGVGVTEVIKDVFTALLPLLIVFIIFQRMWLKLPIDGFGIISLVALTPVLSVFILGSLYEKKQKSRKII